MQSALDHLRRAARTHRRLKILGSVVGVALVAAAPLMDRVQQPWSETAFVLLLTAGLVLSFVAGFVLVFLDETTPDLIARSVSLENERDELLAELDFTDRFNDHLLSRVTTNELIQELLQETLVRGRGDPEALATFSRLVLQHFVERRASLFGIGDEYWNFSVYRYDPVLERLVCVACRRERPEDEEGDHRSWAPCEGHVGLAFSRRSEIVFPDATRPDVRPVVEAREGNRRDYDSIRYVSLASIPITLGEDQPLGVLIATSDRKGRFSTEDERDVSQWDSADVLRTAASSLATVFGILDAFDGRRRDGEEDRLGHDEDERGGVGGRTQGQDV